MFLFKIKNLGLQVPLWISIIFILLSPSAILSQNYPTSQWHDLYVTIRDRLIAKEEALDRLKEIEVLLKDSYLKAYKEKSEDRLCFPLKGYFPSSIGGKEGSGYQPQGYDFFDGNDHGGHPGHDIFVRDKNQDGLDDLTGQPVEVISASPGMVVSVNFDWIPPSPLRGGNYIWIYDPIRKRYYYYAHLNEIFINLGQIVSMGDRLGTIGRTGVRAYPKKSPTHLHFVVHESINGYPNPINPYLELMRAKRG